ncbi:ParA family protein [Burkholderia vietnamiensis]|uniref:ParA family protein n=1 Tax=Burkholderia vietnamiensis TaxID=60552 RepID=UPI0026523D56|nr:AAA family ATPase [Burkholderia vietnamiensis]MDN8035782.1 AAA family ATPase [Burkholderia vietnamiensis]
MPAVTFNDAVRLAAATVNHPVVRGIKIVVVRDVVGRIRFAVDALRPTEAPVREAPVQGKPDDDSEPRELPAEAFNVLAEAGNRLGPYAAHPLIVFRDDLGNPRTILENEDIHEAIIDSVGPDADVAREYTVNLLDRQIVGQDWLNTQALSDRSTRPPRVVFYGLKGGVGRSTALAMFAYSLAREGKRVLLIDFDLESPGLSGLLLPKEGNPSAYGIVDWFVEDAVNPEGNDVIENLVVSSPLSKRTDGEIRVAPAISANESAYLSKLARVYVDVPGKNGPQRFGDRAKRLVEALETAEKPDIVLIDSRAGLHDLAAISISTLADLSLLFATDGQQTWEGYRQLFLHWNRRPMVLRYIRERLAFVRSMLPETNQAEVFESFRSRSYALFSDYMYDEIKPKGQGDDTVDEADKFNFPFDDGDAPHHPLTIRWSLRLVEFDPLRDEANGGVGDADIDFAFKPFVDRVKSLVFED